MPGTLTLVATPIGNLGDITHRALEILGAADLILAEDTRHSGKLLAHYGIKVPMASYHDHNKERVTPGIVARLGGGENIALITDAGTPGISDPGFYIVRAAIEAGVFVSTAPGPSAAIAGLVLSGFATDRFIFNGFTPKKKGELDRVVTALTDEPRTTLFYVAPHQLLKVLDAFARLLPERALAVARELTKVHEEVLRGTGAEILARYEGKRVRGEIVLVVSGAGKRKKKARESGKRRESRKTRELS